jgi:phenylacetate-CoA oxygenase PaaI subunit
LSERTLAEPALAGLIACLADNKCYLGRRYAEWCTAAPTLESAVAAASMAQDEIGHARSFYPVLRDVAGPSPENDAETRTQWTNTAFLNGPFESWTDFVAANFLFDTVLSVLLESATDSTFTPLAQRARRILEEEPLHWLHGEGWVRRLAQKGGGVKAALQQSLDRITPESLEWFDVANMQLVSEGVVRSGADELRESLRGRVNPVLAGVGLSLV